ncbi:MAG: hypothetical protein IKE81_03085 [Clostridia bacterium]|nr:hypothetical protein [Clostridia bacterium]
MAWTNLAYLILLVIMMAHYGMPPATALVLYNYNGKAYASARALSGATTSVYALLLAAERVYQILKSPDFAQEEFGQEKLYRAILMFGMFITATRWTESPCRC